MSPSARLTRSLKRVRTAGPQRVTNAELLFDLVYVFAITQLSHRLIEHPTVEVALQTLILFGLVWEAWAYTMWTTNWLDPDLIPVRAMLFALAFGSLVLSLSIPEAFTDRGWALAGAYAAMHIGRSAFAVWALADDRSLQRNYQRILCWCIASSALAFTGAAVEGTARELLWAGVVVVDVLGGVTGFYTPGLGRSGTRDWTIDGGHLAERCQAFVLIALGESIVVLGATLSSLDHIETTDIVVFVFGFLGVIGMWWIYFARSAESATEVITRSSDPGRYGRAYHELHPVMIGGIIVIAASVELVLAAPVDGDGGDHVDRARRQRALHRRARGVQGLPVAGTTVVADHRCSRPRCVIVVGPAHSADCAGRVRARRDGGRLHQRCGRDIQD